MTTETMEPAAVAKKSKPARKPTPEPEPPPDVVLRLPPEYDLILSAMKKRGRAKVVSAQIALERLAKAEGIPFTPNWPENLGPGGIVTPPSQP